MLTNLVYRNYGEADIYTYTLLSKCSRLQAATYVLMLASCSSKINLIRHIHAHARSSGVELDVDIVGGLMTAYILAKQENEVFIIIA